jgi:preprotein translocase subunit SecE
MPLPDLSGAAMTPSWKAPNHLAGLRKVMAKTSPGEFVNQVRAEARKVVWPSRQETTTTAIFVGLMMVVLSVFFLGIDTLFGALVSFLLKLA